MLLYKVLGRATQRLTAESTMRTGRHDTAGHRKHMDISLRSMAEKKQARGVAGALARAKALSPTKRSAIAKKASAARWKRDKVVHGGKRRQIEQLLAQAARLRKQITRKRKS